jgi:ring-1,2-phenylacetyl-CoA epoxidase subunit PaaC
MLASSSSFQPLAQLAKKIKGEIKYHTLHADTFINQLGNGSEESKARLQSALNYAWPFALGIFEKSEFEDELIKENVFAGEKELKRRWLEKTLPILEAAHLKIPSTEESRVTYGGRKGIHSEHLKPMLDEMREVLHTDINAEW